MILRIRLPSGATERVTIADGEGLDHLGQKINQLNKLDGEYSLYRDPRFNEPFVFETARHGDIIFVKGTLQASAQNGQSSSTPSSGVPARTHKRGPKCRCPPNGMCEHCMPKEDKNERVATELKKMGKHASSIAVLEALEALKFRISPQEEAHVSSAAINNEAANAFQAYLGETGYSHQRVGFCFGKTTSEKVTVKEEDSKEVKNKISTNIKEEVEKTSTNIHVIYEPPQVGNEATYSLLEDDNQGDITKRAHTISTLLDLQFLGIVISTKPRKCILSAKDIVFICKIISDLPDEIKKVFTIFVVSMGTDENNTQISFEAFQISDLALQIYESDTFEDLDKQKLNGGRVLCKQDVLIEGKDTKKNTNRILYSQYTN